MFEWIAYLFGEFLLIYEESKFWKRKKKRREYEKENNLPKKRMISPFMKFGIILITIIIIAKISLGFIYFSGKGEKRTTEKMNEISTILDSYNKKYGEYPGNLNLIIKGYPLRQKLIYDYWKNDFDYKLLNGGLNYSLISKGKDEIINTKDDLTIKK